MAAPLPLPPQSLPAVDVRDLRRDYGKTRVLHHLNLTVPAGSIYGLLGPSGCGKTSLLKCLLGRLVAHGGQLRVFGEVPGTNPHIPGPDVGYMPQELALYEEFNFQQHLKFYGRLVGMTSDQIRDRAKFLRDFLSLPDTTRRVGSMSGGQQRRISLACALLHSPRLLLLDEPTVGIDPVLRARLWQHLRTLSQQGTTIIITTHYIEEARQADWVGFMRNGTILEQGSPAAMIDKYGCHTLEETFLKLCARNDGDDDDDENDSENGDGESGDDDNDNDSDALPSSVAISSGGESLNTSLLQSSINRVHSDGGVIDDTPVKAHRLSLRSYLPRSNYLIACIWRNCMRFLNNIPALIFVFLLPSIQVCLFCIAIGKDPSSINFGVVNYDTVSGVSHNLTDTILDELGRHSLNLRHYNSEADALSAAKDNTVWGYVVIPVNYTANVASLIANPYQTGNRYNDSIIYYNLDMSDVQIATFITKSLSESMIETVQDELGPSAMSSLPVQPRDPSVYGSSSSSFTDFIAPGMIITIAFSQSIGLTALIFVVDSKSGVSDRAYGAGLRSSELMLSHSVTQLLILSIQIVILMFFGLIIFDLPMEGSIVLVFVICLSLAFSGVLYGLVIAALCSEERQAMQLALGSFFPALLLSGVIWPVMAVPVPLNYLSWILPTTWASEAGRDVMSRGWGLSHGPVWQALLVIGGWNLGLFLIAVWRLKTQK